MREGRKIKQREIIHKSFLLKDYSRCFVSSIKTKKKTHINPIYHTYLPTYIPNYNINIAQKSGCQTQHIIIKHLELIVEKTCCLWHEKITQFLLQWIELELQTHEFTKAGVVGL